MLLFCFNHPAFPVDTHVGHVTRRLGLAGPKDSEEKIKAIWESLAPAAWFYPLSLNLIRHGREACHAQRPECTACALKTSAHTHRNPERSNPRKEPSMSTDPAFILVTGATGKVGQAFLHRFLADPTFAHLQGPRSMP